jgi:2-dehydropantoate 2-reductase
LAIASVEGDFTLPRVNAYATVEAMPPCDVVLVALKTTQNHLLSDLLPPLVKPGGAVLLFQNGLGMEPAVHALVGEQVLVVGGLCFICANKVGPGQIHHLDYGRVLMAIYGDRYLPQPTSPLLQKIAADFEQASLETRLSENLMLARWQKLVWNIPFNGLSVILDALTDALIAHPQTYKLATQLMHEVAAAAAGYQLEISENHIQAMLADTRQMPPYRTSMKIDYDERRPLEVEAILGNPIRYAAQVGVAMRSTTMLYQQLQFLNERDCLTPRTA